MKLREEPFPAQETIGQEEIDAVNEVMKTGILSHYRGNYSERFYGGPKVQEFEKIFSGYHNVEHTIAVNSCTSALQIACGAIGLKSGDEVIVSPWSMSCSASAPLVYGATPVFADIDDDYFCLSLESVLAVATEKTKAIIAVSLFGQVFDPKTREWADANGVIIIEDAAQAIGSTYDADINLGSYSSFHEKAGTLGHIGCFSFTQGKHLTAGEGGAIITDNPILAQKCRMIRNHSESVLHDMQNKENMDYIDKSIKDMAAVGYNMRMTEIQAAILIEQIKKLDRFIHMRRNNVQALNMIFGKYPDVFTLPKERDGCYHSYYVYALKVKDRNREIANRLNELLPGEDGRPDKPQFGGGYIEPLYRFPILEKYGPLQEMRYNNISFKCMEKGIFETVERLYNKEAIVTTLVGSPLREEDYKLIEEAVDKVVKEFGEDE